MPSHLIATGEQTANQVLPKRPDREKQGVSIERENHEIMSDTVFDSKLAGRLDSSIGGEDAVVNFALKACGIFSPTAVRR